MRTGSEDRGTGSKPPLVPLCPRRIPHDLTRHRTRHSYGMDSNGFVWTKTPTHLTQLDPDYGGSIYLRNYSICGHIQVVQRPKSRINVRRQCLQGIRAAGQAQTSYEVAFSVLRGTSHIQHRHTQYTHWRRQQCRLRLCVIRGM
jgi:hypothetical protein